MPPSPFRVPRRRAATMLDPFLRGGMTIYARTAAGTFVPLILAIRALVSIPITLAVSAALGRRQGTGR